jgi:hypothetical protein
VSESGVDFCSSTGTFTAPTAMVVRFPPLEPCASERPCPAAAMLHHYALLWYPTLGWALASWLHTGSARKGGRSILSLEDSCGGGGQEDDSNSLAHRGANMGGAG